MNLNHTTPFILTSNIKSEFPKYYALIPLVLALSACIVAVVFYMRRISRLDELRHRLIPLYNYDEEEDWGDYDKDDEEKELSEPLYKDSQLSFTSDHRT
ncbi:small integral membrane protein 29-like [Girardinichthys multiradiatus]|uniref:small integral membrane protein 29-like n=1 Tax=Girardinichthys multiradiatus TaxID=208333 RepID=UPI001FABF0BB|nr:small integral membrane protein 29-like [Girardinichthys multiradiatus]